jgi:hypothetical protein
MLHNSQTGIVGLHYNKVFDFAALADLLTKSIFAGA